MQSSCVIFPSFVSWKVFLFDGVLSPPAGVMHFYHQSKLNKVHTEVPEDKQGGLEASDSMFGRKLTVNVTAIRSFTAVKTFKFKVTNTCR